MTCFVIFWKGDVIFITYLDFSFDKVHHSILMGSWWDVG